MLGLVRWGMRSRSRLIPTLLAMACSGPAGIAIASSPDQPVELVVDAGRPLRLALDRRVRVKRVGQPVTATLTEPTYAYDRMVIPAGARAFGLIERLDRPSRRSRWLGFLRLDFSPARAATLRFDKLVLEDGTEIPLSTRVGPAQGNVVLSTSEPPRKGLATRTTDAAKASVHRTVGDIKRRGKLRRVKDGLLQGLPFHGQFIDEGTVYDAELLAPLAFGTVVPIERAPAGTHAPPDAVLSARLLTSLGSASTPRGTPIHAVLTVPLLSEDQRLLLPEGTELTGEVTLARPARHFHRNGQLRILFESARVADEAPVSLMGSLFAAEVSGGRRLSIDDEGGARMTNSNTRFIAPALSLAALAATTAMEPVTEPGTFEPGVLPGAMEPSSLGAAAGGFSGLGLVGIGLSQLSHPVAVGLGVMGLGRSLYGSVIGKGREVAFPAGTRMQMQIAPPARPPEADAP
jgi:hypothetical protein